VLHNYIVYYILHPVEDEHSSNSFHGDTEVLESSRLLMGSLSSPLSYVVNNLDGKVGNTVTTGADCGRWS